ncbi:sperm motility kinase X [Phodopus roborovskii]|uniref:sperm motility kinase X n=1 Tax=Phodopus roborovskii TaxID=109678 RepID=UPI0021E4E820|nr:sperm motility kinase X [Phodopus roborovskii]
MEQGREACCSTEEASMTDYKMMMTLGQGHFSEVKLAFHVPTLTCVAVKVLRNKKKNSSLEANEVNIMKSVEHPNIIKLYHVVQSRSTTYLVMEHASQGDLLHHILELGSLQESEVRRLFTQILSAVQYCHNNHIVHRDIKANNILLDCRGNAKLCDFGIAAKVPPGQKLKDFCGTMPYCAPELFGEEAYDGCASDVWSLGVLLFLMVVGRFPFRSSSSDGLRRQILAANFSIPQHVSIDIFNVIVELLMINPGRRPTIDQIMRRPMIRASKTHSLTPSTKILPGTPNPSIVSTMTVMGYKPEEIIDSLRDQKYNQVMATYLILQHQSPGGDCCHRQVKPLSVPLRRATEPAPLTCTLASLPQEKEREKNSRQGGTRHSMPATLCCQSKRNSPPSLEYLGCPMDDFLKYRSEEMSENFSKSKIGLCDRLMATDRPSALMYINSSRLDHNETTFDIGNKSFCSPQKEHCSSMETAQRVTHGCSSPGDTLQVETITQEAACTEEVTITQEEAITLETAMTQESNTSLGDIITQEEEITSGQPEDTSPASSPHRRRPRWKRVKKTIVNCLRHLCCCLPPAKRSSNSSKNLAPKTQDLGATPRTSPEEVEPQLHGL